jgi:YegS/Rv2252/BmrU family lipid kinase
MTPIRQTLIITNPKAATLHSSGAKKAVRAAARIPGVLILETQYAGHAGDFCRAHGDDFGKVIAVGGDGLLMDVANALIGKNIPLAPLPAGSGSDFAKALPGHPCRLADLLTSDRVIHADVGKAHFTDGSSQIFLTEAGTGIDAACLRLMPHWLRSLSAKRAYDIGAIRAILTYQPFEAAVKIDDRPLELSRVWIAAVCNTRFCGDGIPIAPNAEVDDGQLHVCLVSDISRTTLLRKFPRVRKGTHTTIEGVTYRDCASVEIDAPTVNEMCIDGDHVPKSPTRWEILPAALPITIPA